jgi:hypothetical protein
VSWVVSIEPEARRRRGGTKARSRSWELSSLEADRALGRIAEAALGFPVVYARDSRVLNYPWALLRASLQISRPVKRSTVSRRGAQSRNRTSDTRIFNPVAEGRKGVESRREGETGAGGVADV